MRDDFPDSTKRTVAARTAYRCSNPACRAQTSGPQVDPVGTLNVGVAAHVAGASPLGPRYDVAMTPEQRADTDNAIWLCQTCAKLVDNDTARFTVAVLHEWKTKAEALALSEIGQVGAPLTGAADKWVSQEYVQRSGLLQQLAAQGFRLYWAAANREAELIDLEGWEYVIGVQPDGSQVRYKIRDHPVIGGYLVLLNMKKA